MAQIIGRQSTAQLISQTRLVRLVDQELAELEPKLAPLITFTQKMRKWKEVDSPRLEWFEHEYVTHWITNSSTAVTSPGTTEFVVTDATGVVAGDVLLVPQAAGSSASPELLLVKDVNLGTSKLTVQRAFAGSTARTIPADCGIAVLGQAFAEGSAVATAKANPPVAKISYTQIFQKTRNFTKTQIASKAYASGGNERKRQQNEMLNEFKIAMNRQFLFGKASEDLSGTTPLRTTMGLNSVISTNVFDAGGMLTHKAFQHFAQMSFRYPFNGKTKLLLACPTVAAAIHMWGNSHLQLRPMEKVFGVDITRIQTAFGQWLMVTDQTLEDGVAGQPGFGGWAFSIDVDNLEVNYLKGRNAKLSENVVKNGDDAEIDQVLGEIGLKIKLEKTHAKMYNVTDYEA